MEWLFSRLHWHGPRWLRWTIGVLALLLLLMILNHLRTGYFAALSNAVNAVE